MKIYYSSKFVREYKKLPTSIREQAKKSEKLFRVDPFNPNLKTHKLHGPLKEFWSFSIDFDHRVIFEFYKNGIVWFHSIGSHSLYQ